MASPKRPAESISGCEYLGNNMYHHEATTSSVDNTDPALVILCTWMGGASARRIEKYVVNYTRVFPESAILVVRTVIPDFIGTWTAKARRARFAGAATVVRDVVAKRPGGEVLMHVMSNGGCNMAIQVLLAVREAGVEVPLGKMVFDCCPGFDGLGMYYRAAAHSIPKGFVAQMVGRPAIFSVVAMAVAGQKVNLSVRLNDMREQLNDETLVGKHVRRLYLYSFSDPLIPWGEVRQHSVDALACGYPVESVVFEDGLHCALLLRDEARYSKAIKDFWAGKELAQPAIVTTGVSTGGGVTEQDVNDQEAGVLEVPELRSKL